MSDFLLEYYLWIKSFHVIAVIAWMAGLLYLPRLFVYHAGVASGSAQSEIFKTMEYRLLKYIMNPAMVVTWVLGLMMLSVNGAVIMESGGWMHAKLLLVIIMSAAHMAFGVWRKKFANDTNTHSTKFYRVWNEVPTILMIIIVVLVVVKPF